MASLTITDLASLNSAFTTVNDGFEDLRYKMQHFLSSFDVHVQQRRDLLLSSKQEYLKGVAEDREIMNELQRQIELYKQKEIELSKSLEKERQEIREVEEAISDFQQQKQVLAENREALQSEIEDMRKKLQKKREYKIAQRRSMEAQTSKNAPELAFFEEKLAMKIRGVRPDVLQFVFTHINESDWLREYSFVVDVSTRKYKVAECDPTFPNLNTLVEELNDSRSFFTFLKEMRKEFREYASKNRV